MENKFHIFSRKEKSKNRKGEVKDVWHGFSLFFYSFNNIISALLEHLVIKIF